MHRNSSGLEERGLFVAELRENWIEARRLDGDRAREAAVGGCHGADAKDAEERPAAVGRVARETLGAAAAGWSDADANECAQPSPSKATSVITSSSIRA